MQDPALVDHLGSNGIVLEVCPTSNIATRAVETLEQHPIRAMVDAGLRVTVNSDPADVRHRPEHRVRRRRTS